MIACLLVSFVITKVNGYTLGKLFHLNNLNKIKKLACSGIHDNISYTARRSDGVFGPIYGVKQLTQGQKIG